MKNATLLKIASLFIFLLTAQSTLGQDHAEPEFFLEDFSDQLDKGVDGNGSDFSGVNWTMDVSDCTLSGSNDYFKVNGNATRLRAKDVDGDAIWYSESVDISCYTEVSFKLYARLDAQMESSDFIKIQYRLNDTGNWILAQNGDLPGTGSDNAYNPEQFGLNGTSLQLKVTINVNEGNETPFIDGMKVYGTAIPAPTAYAVSADNEALCSGDVAIITVADSETGVNYQLKKDGANEGAAIAGTGSAIEFTGITTAGTYTVSATSSCSSATMSGNVVITAVAAVSASFTSSITNQDVTFTNTSSNATSYSWDFGDGSSASTEINPTHTYATTGTYTVTLIASNNCGSDTATTSITVTVPSSLFYIDAGGSDSNDGLTTATAFATLAKAIEMTTNNLGTTINIAAGTYTEKAITISKNNITITGAGSASTIFDGDADGRFLTIEANNIVLNNLTLKEYGYLGELTSSGTVIFLTSGTGVIFNDIVFDSNVSTTGSFGPIVYGGIFYISNGVNLTINSSIFKNNTFGNENSANDYYRGGVFYNVSGGILQVNNSLFYDNTTSGYGSALFSASGSQATFTNCTLEGNTSWGADDGVTYSIGTDDTFINSIIWNTRYQNSAGTDIADLNATNVVYGSGFGNTLSGNNSTVDPFFTDVSSFDYTTQYNSFAVDGGDSAYAPADDINKLSRPQGQADDIGAYEHQNTWNGSISTNWNAAANWTENVVPVSGRSPIIAPTSNNPIINGNDGSSNDGNVVLDNITIKSSAALTIEKDGSLNIAKDFNNQGTVTLNSDATEFASIVVGATATGNITYNRWVNKTGPFEGNNWDFVGSPVKNQRIDNFVSANSGVLPNSGDIYGIAKYFNEWDSWEWYTDSNIGDDIFNTGESYYTSTIVTGDASGATLAFTGEIPTGTQTKEIINNNGTNTIGRRWEMVANPYASYIHGNPASGDAVNNFVKVNLDLNLLEPSFGAIYAWNGTGGYTIYNLSQINTATIAPGQGFWIAARQGTPQQLQFTPAMQTVEGGDDFISGAPILLNYMLNLKLYHGTTEKAKTSFYFQQGLSDGLDTGYDAGALEQTQAISSRLTENDQGYNMSINAMSIETVYNQSIPLVINQQEGQPFRVSISENTIPEEVNVYLEDVLNGTLTSLKDQDFELIAQEDLSEDGRFYIRFTTESLAINDVLSPSNVTVFKLNTDNFITIKGLSPEMGKTTATLYNMLGMIVRSKTLNNTAATQQISTQGLASGVYIINLKAGEQAVSKKVIIQ